MGYKTFIKIKTVKVGEEYRHEVETDDFDYLELGNECIEKAKKFHKEKLNKKDKKDLTTKFTIETR